MNKFNKNTMIDVTKPPYNCDNTGKVDCTEALRQILNDVLQREVDALYATWNKLKENPDPNYRLTFEVCKKNNVASVIFPEDVPDTIMIYFPKGEYLVSDTISHSLEDLKNVLNGNRVMEINRKIYFVGEDKDSTFIKLQDSCNGYGFGNQKPIISFIRSEQSNIAMSNMICDLTIDCGIGNSGAVGIEFFSNNSGTVRNVNVISSDPDKKGFCGVLVNRGTEAYFKDIYVEGFDYGIKIEKPTAPVACENIFVRDQKVTGFLVINANVPVYNYVSENKVCPFRASGVETMVSLIKAVCKGGDPLQSAICINSGEAYIRDVLTEGYRWPLIIGSECHHMNPYIKEISTSVNQYGKNNKENILSLNLPVENAPMEYTAESEEDIAFVDEYGAVGDGITDCTDAIQQALDSGKKVIVFGAGHYFVNGVVTVPRTVRTIDFMFCDFYSGDVLRNSRNKGFFKVEEDCEEHITFKNLLSFEKFYGYFRFIEHACKRTIVLVNVHTQCAGMYFNTVEGGKLFVENCACTMGGDDYCTISPFEFKGQKVWCRNINPERGDVQILNDHSDLWILGMKTETHVGRFASTAVKNINGGRVEGFGILSGIGGKNIPLYMNEQAQMSVFFRANGFSPTTFWDILVRDTDEKGTQELRFEEAYPLTWYSCRVFGYVSL